MDALVLALTELMITPVGEANGLPPPHFQAKVGFQLHVWSGYSGLLELYQIMKKVAEVLDNQMCELEAYETLLRLVRVRVDGQQDSERQKVRQDVLELEARIF